MQAGATPASLHKRLRLRVRGAVQGVGFRPFAFGLAERLALGGFVRNDALGVLIEVEGAQTDAFLRGLRENTLPLAKIDAIDVDALPLSGAHEFRIESTVAGQASTRIGADSATCDACLDELFDSNSRFFHYPFINCTHCGPRYTLTRALPYDRAQTSMANFPMCTACAADYANPRDRRFHAEPIACPACGPKLSHSLTEIADTVRAGKIVALKGLGGFHLVCDAQNTAAVQGLRQRKQRDAKPFAVMVANLASVDFYAEMSEAEAALLSHRTRPIVLLKSLKLLAPEVAPNLAHVGVMLPYTPLNHLLFQALGCGREAASPVALVATSANLGGEPLVASNEDAARRLGEIADLIVTHDRDIVVRADDSVMQIIDKAPVFLRRARGFVPEPIELAEDGPTLLGAGADLKNTITLTRGREAFISQHIGDLDNRETLRFRRETIEHLCTILAVKPEIVALDLHPDFMATRSLEHLDLPRIFVQHHVAHSAAVVAEHRLTGPVLGVALDGHGHGADGTPWGGELIRLEGANWQRLGSLQPLKLPGGDKAAREPWRMGVAALERFGRLDLAAKIFPAVPAAQIVAKALQKGMICASSSSLGRVFDAAAALAGTCSNQRYEGQAAMEFEALVRQPRVAEGSWRIFEGKLDLMPLLDILVREKLRGQAAAELFHGTLIAALTKWILQAAQAQGLTQIALSGGCIMNRTLTEGLCQNLRAAGLKPYIPRAVPANDGGISLGQVAFARHKIKEEPATCA